MCVSVGEGGEGGGGEEEGGGGGGGGVSGVVAGSGERAHRARRRASARDKLPNKPLDWQVHKFTHDPLLYQYSSVKVSSCSNVCVCLCVCV